MIACGWCHTPTKAGMCTACGRDAVLPWTQRGQEPPTQDPREAIRKRLAAARADLGDHATIEQIADHLDVSPRTVRRWRELAR